MAYRVVITPPAKHQLELYIAYTIRVLKSMGIDVKAARSGREIIKRINAGETYDLIIIFLLT